MNLTPELISIKTPPPVQFRVVCVPSTSKTLGYPITLEDESGKKWEVIDQFVYDLSSDSDEVFPESLVLLSVNEVVSKKVIMETYPKAKKVLFFIVRV